MTKSFFALIVGACFIVLLSVGVIVYYPTIQKTTGEPVPNNHNEGMAHTSYQEGLWSD